MPLDDIGKAGREACLRLAPDGPLVLALSGGGDSTALALLLSDLARQTGRPFHTLIVDHRLRADSAAEADLTARRAEALGAEAQILVWTNPAPGQGAARAARHRLLADTCRNIGSQTLFLAHTADDVIETMIMRLTRKQAGWRALAAMGEQAMSPVWPEGRGLRLLRPLVRASRAGLRAFLTRQGADWIEDPSNANTRFERVRVRQSAPLPHSPAGAALLALNDTALALDGQVRSAAFALLGERARLHGWGGLTLDAPGFARAPSPVALRAMEAVMAAVSGQADLPRAPVVDAFLKALCAGQPASGGGALLTSQGMLGRDPGASAGRADGQGGASTLELQPGEAGVFDGRFLVCAGHEPLTVSAAGAEKTHAGAVPPVLRASLVRVQARHKALVAGLDEAPGGAAIGSMIADRIAHVLNADTLA